MAGDGGAEVAKEMIEYFLEQTGTAYMFSSKLVSAKTNEWVYKVTFSKPTKVCPVPKHVVNCTFTVYEEGRLRDLAVKFSGGCCAGGRRVGWGLAEARRGAQGPGRPEACKVAPLLWGDVSGERGASGSGERAVERDVW